MSCVVPCLLLFLAASTGSATAATTSAHRQIAFGEGRQWGLFDVKDRTWSPLTFPKDVSPEFVTSARDGKIVFFTAFDAKAKNVLLFAWNRKTNSVRSIGDSRGYHSSPSLSPDEQFIYFAHSPYSRGPPGAHNDKAYAQIYRVHADGSSLEALTDERGCHSRVAPSSSGLYIVHSHCTDNIRELELRSNDKLTRIAIQPNSWGEAVLSNDGRKLLLVAYQMRGIQIFEMSTRSHILTHLHEALNVNGHAMPAYGSTDTEVLFLRQRKIVSLRNGQEETAAVIE